MQEALHETATAVHDLPGLIHFMTLLQNEFSETEVIEVASSPCSMHESCWGKYSINAFLHAMAAWAQGEKQKQQTHNEFQLFALMLLAGKNNCHT